MSLLKDVKKLSKTLPKIALYGAGGLALAWPLVQTAQYMRDGYGPTASVRGGIKVATGYDVSSNVMDWNAATNAMWRTGFGAAAIYIARKL